MLEILFGFISGTALGLTGGGGAILAVPLLHYGLGQSTSQAVMISLVTVLVSALIALATHLRSNNINWKAGFIIALTGISFAPLGAVINRQLPDPALMTGFAIVMTVIGVLMWTKSNNSTQKTSACRLNENNQLQLSKKCASVLLLTGVIAGLLTGIFGVGGGFLTVPALMLAASLNIRQAIATSMLVIVLTSTSSLASHLVTQSLNMNIATWFILGSVIGILLGTRLSKILSAKILQKSFSALILIVAITILL